MARGPTEFWYATWGDAENGFLVDLIRRPEASQVRVAVFQRGQPARVLRAGYPRHALSAEARGQGARLAEWRVDRHGCTGRIADLAVKCAYRLLAPEVTLVPAWVAHFAPSVPALWSTPGVLSEATDLHPAGLPCVFTRYRIGDIAQARWFLISAQAFEGSDARCEISGGWFRGRWALTGYLQLGGQLMRLNSPLANLRRFHVQAVGDQTGPGRRLALTYRSRQLSLRLIAEAPSDTFVELEREGATTIRTSLFASCVLQVSVEGKKHHLVARNRCLLEVKH